MLKTIIVKIQEQHTHYMVKYGKNPEFVIIHEDTLRFLKEENKDIPTLLKELDKGTVYGMKIVLSEEVFVNTVMLGHNIQPDYLEGL